MTFAPGARVRIIQIDSKTEPYTLDRIIRDRPLRFEAAIGLTATVNHQRDPAWWEVAPDWPSDWPEGYRGDITIAEWEMVPLAATPTHGRAIE